MPTPTNGKWSRVVYPVISALVVVVVVGIVSVAISIRDDNRNIASKIESGVVRFNAQVETLTQALSALNARIDKLTTSGFTREQGNLLVERIQNNLLAIRDHENRLRDLEARK